MKAPNAPFWGRLKGHHKAPLFIDYDSNAMTVAPAGSGKGIYTVVPAGMAIRHSKVFSDFKGELACMLKEPLEKRGETVRILNPGNLWSDILGEGDSYNPLDIIVDDLHRPGGLRDIPDDLREMAAQIQSEPAEGNSDDSYWREGGRRAIGTSMLIESMIDEYEATLSSVTLLIEDRKKLEHHLRWVLGIDLKGKPSSHGPMPIEQAPWASFHDPLDVKEFAALIRAWASNTLSLMCNQDSKTFDSFISGAQQALAPYAFGRLAPAMRKSTFSMNDLKEKVGEQDKATNLFIVADSSRMESYKSYIGLMQWCATTAMKRHFNKGRPVYFIMDEATNYKIHGLDTLLTWGRSYGLRLHLIFQDLNAFERTYGKSTLETLLSETEIKQFLPGQRSQKTLELVSQMLGNQTVPSTNLSQGGPDHGLNEHVGESKRELRTPDEIRRSGDGILFVRQAPPVLFEPISYAEVHPWRKQVGINPFHNKPYLKPVKLRLSWW